MAQLTLKGPRHTRMPVSLFSEDVKSVDADRAAGCAICFVGVFIDGCFE